jgi:membrane protease YdiL (CAAX protease family)
VTGPGVLDFLTLTILLVALPVFSIAQLRHLEGVELRPMPIYASSAVTLLILGGGCVAVGVRRGGPAALGIVALPGAATAAWTAGLTLGGLAVLLAFRALGSLVGATEGPLLRLLLPRSASERVAFIGLSIAAGAGEELAYRGYAISALAPLLGPFWAAALSSAVFGVLHVYQGRLGIVRTAVLGGLLAWGFLASGSLWPPMLAHAALDVIAGTVLADRLMVPAGATGVPTDGGTDTSRPDLEGRPEGE